MQSTKRGDFRDQSSFYSGTNTPFTDNCLMWCAPRKCFIHDYKICLLQYCHASELHHPFCSSMHYLDNPASVLTTLSIFRLVLYFSFFKLESDTLESRYWRHAAKGARVETSTCNLFHISQKYDNLCSSVCSKIYIKFIK